MTSHLSPLGSRFFRSFISAVNWNAFFYTLYKICFVSLTFVLYRVLPTDQFSQWATINSVLFLSLLWLNCGFKKSIPRFAPVFSRDRIFHRNFIIALLAFKSCLLFVGIPVITKVINLFIPHFAFLPLVLGVFVTEGLCSLFLLIYHAHFWQKQFNLIQAFFLLLEILLGFSYIFFFYTPPAALVSFLFLSKLVGNLGVILLSLLLLPSLYRNTLIPAGEPFEKEASVRAFMKHSFVMWTIAILQSLSERNFIFPLITSVQGATVGNIFKVIHDAAIFFQRIALQTIGIADTALLSYIEVTDKRVSQLRLAFASLFKVVFLLCVPLLCTGIFFFFRNHADIPNSSAFLFLVVALGSTLEIILSPYARVLEVKLRYRDLFFSYLPYVLGYALLTTLYAASLIPLITFVSVAQAIRLGTTLAMVYYAKRDFEVQAPSLFAGLVLSSCGIGLFVAWLFFSH